MKNGYPRISIVTPVFNQVNYLEKAICSVVGQGYPNLEYVIVDGGSTDGTLNVIRKHDSQIARWISEKDNGMYDALDKGFKLCNGEIMGWINSDDVLMPGSLFNMARLFNDLPCVSWIQGLNCIIDLEENIVHTYSPHKFSFLKFLRGDFKWIQQESTFWRKSLWEKAGSRIDTSLTLAGDFELWFRFFQYDKLYNSSVPIGAFRRRDGQMSALLKDEYLGEASDILHSFQANKQVAGALARLQRIDRCIHTLRRLKLFSYSFLVEKQNRYSGLEMISIVYSDEERKYIVC